ncbi:MAG: hypothetical protein WCO56_12205 [Verrucomicrobiota bacterium]
MDIIFKCPGCGQELEVDAAGAGSEIQCPACNSSILIPAPSEETKVGEVRQMPPEAEPGALPTEAAPEASAAPPAEGEKGDSGMNPSSASAAAKEDKHFAVPTREGPVEVLIKKANKPLEVAAKESDRRIRIRTIRHVECHELGRDRFDEIVSEFLQKIGQKDVIAIHPIGYTHLDPATQKLLEDYGVIVVFNG